MTDAELLPIVTETVEEVTGNYGLTLTAETIASEVPGWDSLAHLNIVIGLEKRLGVRLTTAELAGLKSGGRTVGDLAALLAARTA